MNEYIRFGMTAFKGLKSTQGKAKATESHRWDYRALSRQTMSHTGLFKNLS